MKSIYYILTLSLLLACKDNNTISNNTVAAPVVVAPVQAAAPSSEELINAVLGTHNGTGNYQFDKGDSSTAKIISSVKIERRDDVTVIVSSPDNLFPSYEIGEFRQEGKTGQKIYGHAVRGRGFIYYDTKRKRIMALVKRFDEETAELQFAS